MVRQSSPQAEREKTINIGPICRFGPGGDYVSVWPGEPVNPAEQPNNALTGILNVLAGMIEALRGNRDIRGKINNETDDRRGIDTPTGADVTGNHGAPKQRWLFADDRRAGGTIKYKPHHRIRAHRASAKKRVCFGPAGQSTLFESNLKGTKSA